MPSKLPCPTSSRGVWSTLGPFLATDEVFAQAEEGADRKVPYPQRASALGLVAQRGVLTLAQQERILARQDPGLCLELASNPTLDPSLQERLWEWWVLRREDFETFTDLGLALMGRADLLPAVEWMLARYDRTNVLYKLACKVDADPEVLAFLAKHEQDEVRRLVAYNPSLPKASLVALTFEKKFHIDFALRRGFDVSRDMNAQFLWMLGGATFYPLAGSVDRETLDALRVNWAGSLAELVDACALVKR